MKYAIYAAYDGDTVEYRYTHDIRVDEAFYSGKFTVERISPYMPIGYADYLLREICSKPGFVLRFLKKAVRQEVRDRAMRIKRRVEELKISCIDVSGSGYWIDEGIQGEILGVVKGKALLLDEIKSRLPYDEKTLCDNLQVLHLKGELDIIPSIRMCSDGYTCQRCGSHEVFKYSCQRCGNECVYCEECLIMGRTLFCQPYILCPGRNGSGVYREVKLDMPVRLTPAQISASEEVRRFIEGTDREALVWAACGAGKTEVTFDGIREALSWGNKVLYAVPRRDVVIELSQRFKKAFPDEKIAVLYGGSEKTSSDFTIATTHQVMRYYEEFDLVILDEVDAFPYDGNDMLEMAVRRSMKRDGKLLYMTATPPVGLYRAYKRGKIKGILIPARHHGHPLPVPTILKANIDENMSALPKSICSFLEKCVKLNKRVIVFVPTVNLSIKIAEIIKNMGIDADYVYSKDPKRDVKRKRFYNGQLPVIVATTVMERGITVEGVQVIVLFADYNNVFDERTLVQMAGRVGRTESCSTGDVLFVSRTITEEMSTAIEMIEHMNRVAIKKGYVI
ncbi:competence protein ComFA [Caldanaerobius fijiensis DSM 17918]|uniref:Competence protein ComFA n=1 Tax=Caldanaerobius fijiensis DSM 17918 TaxID=1121256 RepID=A0A1M4UWL6_9THEO|nr:DEAD/DEAH box helicase family protein [Caldanaerobius fijiensis]SHE61059.1 competence protein ComFA [Caldanaerobius fijiensis DSM 17918]